MFYDEKLYYLLYFSWNTGGFFISNAKLELRKNQAKVKQHPESEFLLFENYSSISSSMLSSKTNIRYSKKCSTNKSVCFNEILCLIMMKMRQKMKNRSHRYNINRTRSRQRHKCTKYKMCLSTMMIMWN